LEQVKASYDMKEVTGTDLQREEDEISRLRQREQQLIDQQKAQMPKGDDKLSMFRQQVSAYYVFRLRMLCVCCVRVCAWGC